jgi:hypothetical protein
MGQRPYETSLGGAIRATARPGRDFANQGNRRLLAPRGPSVWRPGFTPRVPVGYAAPAAPTSARSVEEALRPLLIARTAWMKSRRPPSSETT